MALYFKSSRVIGKIKAGCREGWVGRPEVDEAWTDSRFLRVFLFLQSLSACFGYLGDERAV